MLRGAALGPVAVGLVALCQAGVHRGDRSGDGTLPGFHVPAAVSPGGAGVSDVNALLELDGVTHLFFGGWTHWVSRDAGATWRELPAPTGLTGGMDGSMSLVDGEPVVLYDCTDWAGCHPVPPQAEAEAARAPPRGTMPRKQPAANPLFVHVRVGDPPIVGIARPSNLSDVLLTNWTRDPANPVVIARPNGTAVTAGYAGPSNLWCDTVPVVMGSTPPATETVSMTMIYGTGTGLFRATATAAGAGALHNWTLVNPEFYPAHGGGGGLFFPLASAPSPWSEATRGPAATAAGAGAGAGAGADPDGPTHMLQVDAPGHPDGVAAFVVGRYDSGADNFTVVGAPHNATLHFLDGDGLLFTQIHATDATEGVPRRGSPGLPSPFSAQRVVDRARAGVQLRYVGWIAPARAISVIRELWWHPDAARFTSNPAPALTRLRSPTPLVRHQGVAVPAGSTFSVLGSGAQTADVELQIHRSTGAAVLSGQDAGNLSSAFTIGVLGGAHRDSAGRTGLAFAVSVSGIDQSVSVTGECSKPAHGKNTPAHCISCPGTAFRLAPDEVRIDFRILIDRTVVELFAGRGRTVCTGSLARMPSEPNTGLYIENGAGMPPLTIGNATVWGMRSGV